MPYSLAVAKLGGHDALMRAVERNDMTTCEDDGTTFYVWREISAGKVTGSDHKTTITSSKKIDKPTAKQLADCFDSMEWELNATRREIKSLEEKKILPEGYEEVIMEAIAQLKSESCLLSRQTFLNKARVC